MSDTPRTDAMAYDKSICQEDANELIWVLAKQLERELARATGKIADQDKHRVTGDAKIDEMERQLKEANKHSEYLREQHAEANNKSRQLERELSAATARVKELEAFVEQGRDAYLKSV